MYREHAPGLALEAARKVLEPAVAGSTRGLVSTSCTGYHLPGWGAELVECLRLSCDVARLPITEAGCAGGVVALARAADLLRTGPGAALAVACELCSLAFHAGGDDGNLTSSLIFGDGAGAALLQTGDGPGLELVDSASLLVPGTRDALGFALTDAGFYPILERRLVDLLPGATERLATTLLTRNGLRRDDVGAWLLHPGGARILERLAACLRLPEGAMEHSWASLRDNGNTSSAAIFDVLRRYLDRPAPAGEWGLVVAFGPGVAIEGLLVRCSC